MSQCLNFYYLSIKGLNYMDSRHINTTTCSIIPFGCPVRTSQNSISLPKPDSSQALQCQKMKAKFPSLLPTLYPIHQKCFDSTSKTHCKSFHLFPASLLPSLSKPPLSLTWMTSRATLPALSTLLFVPLQSVLHILTKVMV